ncbi:FliA/WhiG family RNA polymerase sigma factor [Demequina activiva]|uniref:RNA polymerase sigma factor n=1 Tax=Demequina activiva TaxID=1582364 RepID=A0A919PYV0_9MICO|nr:FliA/WhiG family RNA polymerase sigma factor [Demequina activiva]GIG53250.1 RNA polymerase sigma factor WhiG [Demequina activiva]
MSSLNPVLSQDTEEPMTFAPPRADASQLDQWWSDLADDGATRRDARDALITHYAPLVTQVATRMIGRLPDTVELADLVSYGTFGLIDAVEKFEPARGFKFETYAGQRIRGAIIDELRAADWVPRSVRSKARTVEHAARTLEQTLMRPVTDEDIAAHLGWHTAEVRTVRAQVALSHVAALDGMVAGGETRAIDAVLDNAAPEASLSVEVRETSTLLAGAIQSVRDREQEVLRLYYFENLTLAQIGQILGVTESRVSQIHSGAVKKLRENLMRTGAFM